MRSRSSRMALEREPSAPGPFVPPASPSLLYEAAESASRGVRIAPSAAACARHPSKAIRAACPGGDGVRGQRSRAVFLRRAHRIVFVVPYHEHGP